MVNTILAKRVNHIVAKGDNPAWPKGSKSRGFSSGHHNKLVLHQKALDIAILETGLDLVISPIPVVKPADSGISDARWDKICWEYVPLQLNASGKSPKLFAGRNATQYPEGLNPGLRIGLD